jgi:hypothetical protein
VWPSLGFYKDITKKRLDAIPVAFEIADIGSFPGKPMPSPYRFFSLFGALSQGSSEFRAKLTTIL